MQPVEATVLQVTDAYEEIERYDLVTLHFADGEQVDVKVEGMCWLAGHAKPLQIVSTRSRRYALGEADRVIRQPRERGF